MRLILAALHVFNMDFIAENLYAYIDFMKNRYMRETNLNPMQLYILLLNRFKEEKDKNSIQTQYC